MNLTITVVRDNPFESVEREMFAYDYAARCGARMGLEMTKPLVVEHTLSPDDASQYCRIVALEAEMTIWLDDVIKQAKEFASIKSPYVAKSF